MQHERAPGFSDRHLAIAACIVGLMWSIGAIELSAPKLERVGLLLYGVVLLVLGARGWAIGPSAGLYAIVVGGIERLTRDPLTSGSDVVRATREAIEVILAGGNPYTHVMLNTDPVGSPFVYPPGEPLFYMPAYLMFGGIMRVEGWVGILTIAVIVLAGAKVGWGRAAVIGMLYSVWGIAALRTVDGGNDVAAASLVVVALVTLAFAGPGRLGRVAFILSAFSFGWALAFKQFALLLWPLVLRHVATANASWRRYAAISAGVAAALILPFFLANPAAFIDKQVQALTFHQNVWGANLLAAIQQRTDVGSYLRLFFVAEAVATGGLLLVLMRTRVPSIGVAAVMGAGLLVVPLMLARWTTQSYYVYAATIALTGLLLIEEKVQPEAAVAPAPATEAPSRREAVPPIAMPVPGSVQIEAPLARE